MKEIIVIDNNQRFPRASYYVAKDGHFDVGAVNYATPETILNENRIVAIKEQVPTTWEELKELCKKINSKIVNENAMYESQIIIDTDKGYFGFYYYPIGRIDIVFKSAYSTNHTVAKNRTIPQTWSFIKSLIGEE